MSRQGLRRWLLSPAFRASSSTLRWSVVLTGGHGLTNPVPRRGRLPPQASMTPTVWTSGALRTPGTRAGARLQGSGRTSMSRVRGVFVPEIRRLWSPSSTRPCSATIPTLPQTSGRIPERLPATERTTTGTATGTTSTAIISSMELRTSTGKATGTADTELTWPEPLLRSITMEPVYAASPAAAGAEMELRLCPARYSTKERAPSAAS